jgi:uncharacterized protein (DUF362 family)
MKSAVAIVRLHPQALSSTTLMAVRDAISLLGGIEEFSKSGQKVLVKPNIASPDGYSCTSPSVTWALAKIFSDHGCKVLIGENPAIPTDEDFAYGEYGLHELAKEANAEVVSLRRGPQIRVKVPGDGFFSEIEVSRFAVEADLVVSAATMKSANIVAATLGLKNLKGLVPSAWKRKFHCEGLNQGIVDLNAAVRAGLVVIDGTIGKDWSERVCHPVGIIIASRDLVAADAVCATIMGFDPAEIEHIRLAKEAGLGEFDLKNIDILGEDIARWTGKFHFSPPKDPFKFAEKSAGRIEILQGSPCSVCLNELGQVLGQYEDRLEDFEDLTILIGPEADPSAVSDQRHRILFGSCLKKCADRGTFVHGCPPTDYEAAETGSLINVLDSILERGRSRRAAE